MRILLIDDDEDDYFLTRELISEIPSGEFQLDWAPTYTAGVEAVMKGEHDVYLVDYRLGERTGIELLRETKARGRSGPVILFTGQGRKRTDVEALDAGADDYIEKSGLTAAVLDRAIRFARVQYQAAAELERKVKERTEELACVNQILREADRRKDEFLATIAHELRNPLAPIRNALEILRLDTTLSESVRRQRDRLERQVAQLVRLIDDLLDVSRITTGKLRLTTETLAIQEVIEAALEMVRSQIESANLQLNVSVPTERVLLSGDRVRLTQVVTNILNNAAKFTEPGGKIWLSVSQADEKIRIVVRDSGVGIAPDLLPMVFELFTQVDRSISRSQGGLGIGLALVRRIVEMHDGTITAESAGPGKGATFTITLPGHSAPASS